MTQQKPLSPMARIIFGLLCIASGVMPVLAAFDLGPLDRGAIHGPSWLGATAGGILILGGIALLLGQRPRPDSFSYVLFVLIFGAFAAIGNWIAFGPGPRQCEVAIVGSLFESASVANEITCRVGFGIGAAIMDGVLIWMAAGTLRRLAGPGLLPTWIERVGLALLALGLAPIVLPALLFLIGRSLPEAFAHYRATGRWPRNESFIARMKKKRASAS